MCRFTAALYYTQRRPYEESFSAEELAKMGNNALLEFCKCTYKQLKQKPGVLANMAEVAELRNTFSSAIDMFYAAITPPAIQTAYLSFLLHRLNKLHKETAWYGTQNLLPLVKQALARKPEVLKQFTGLIT